MSLIANGGQNFLYNARTRTQQKTNKNVHILKPGSQMMGSNHQIDACLSEPSPQTATAFTTESWKGVLVGEVERVDQRLVQKP